MKFATIALVATASAITMRAEVEKKCMDRKGSDEIFAHVDTNGNGQIGRKELVAGIKEFSKSQGYTPTDKDWEWVEKTATKDAGKDHTLSSKEFHKWVNQFAKHFKIGGC